MLFKIKHIKKPDMIFFGILKSHTEHMQEKPIKPLLKANWFRW